MFDFKEMLGQMSKEEIMTKLAEAEAELRAEKERDKEVAKLREAMVIAVLDYARAADIVPEDFSISAETMAEVLQAVKDMEDEVREKIGFIMSMTKATDKVKTEKVKLGPGTLHIHTPKDLDFGALDSWLKSL